MALKRAKVRVYQVVRPCAPGYEGKWCLCWQTPVMPGSSFWYFDTELEARESADQIMGGK